MENYLHHFQPSPYIFYLHSSALKRFTVVFLLVIPAKAGIHLKEIPAFAGMTKTNNLQRLATEKALSKDGAFFVIILSYFSVD